VSFQLVAFPLTAPKSHLAKLNYASECCQPSISSRNSLVCLPTHIHVHGKVGKSENCFFLEVEMLAKLFLLLWMFNDSEIEENRSSPRRHVRKRFFPFLLARALFKFLLEESFLLYGVNNSSKKRARRKAFFLLLFLLLEAFTPKQFPVPNVGNERKRRSLMERSVNYRFLTTAAARIDFITANSVR